MSEGKPRLVQALHWFVNDDLEPLVLNLQDTKVYCFFSSRWNAEAFKQGQDLPPGRWTLLSTQSADYLIDLCERVNIEGSTEFALNPPPNYEGRDRRWPLDAFRDVIERPTRGDSRR